MAKKKTIAPDPDLEPTAEEKAEPVSLEVVPKGADGEDSDFGAVKESKRPIDEILREHVTRDGASIKIDDKTPLEEWLKIYDHAKGTEAMSGFYIADTLLFARKHYGDRYLLAMEKTGRATSTVNQYLRVAEAIPPNMRQESLTYSHHALVAPLFLCDSVKGEDGEVITDKKQFSKIAKEILKAAAKDAATTRELKKKMKGILPAKETKPAGKKRGRKPKVKQDPEEPNPEECAAMEALLDTLANANALLNVAHGEGNKRTLLAAYPKFDNAHKNALLREIEILAKLAGELE